MSELKENRNSKNFCAGHVSNTLSKKYFPSSITAVSSSEKTGLSWTWYDFEELPLRVFYEIARLRQDIFIIEQNAPYTDLDGKDFDSKHLVCTLSEEVVAYMRILPPDLFKPGSYSLGRVTVRRDLRGTGLGRALVARGIARLNEIRGMTPIEISSQFYLVNFYNGFGFFEYGDQYIEDHIPHIAMKKS